MATQSNPGPTYQKLGPGIVPGTVNGAEIFDYSATQKATHATNMKSQLNTSYLTRLRLAGK